MDLCGLGRCGICHTSLRRAPGCRSRHSRPRPRMRMPRRPEQNQPLGAEIRRRLGVV